MQFLISIAMLCFAISIYFKYQSLNPTIEQDGEDWVIRVGNRFVDAEFMCASPGRALRLISGRDSLDYRYCKFDSKEEAELYFVHVCNFTAEGKLWNM